MKYFAVTLLVVLVLVVASTLAQDNLHQNLETPRPNPAESDIVRNGNYKIIKSLVYLKISTYLCHQLD